MGGTCDDNGLEVNYPSSEMAFSGFFGLNRGLCSETDNRKEEMVECTE